MSIDDELETVIRRMHDAGWPEPVAIGATELGRRQWRDIIEALADRYLRSTVLRVDTLVALGPLAKENLTMALDLAGWDGEVAVHTVEAE